MELRSWPLILKQYSPCMYHTRQIIYIEGVSLACSSLAYTKFKRQVGHWSPAVSRAAAQDIDRVYLALACVGSHAGANDWGGRGRGGGWWGRRGSRALADINSSRVAIGEVGPNLGGADCGQGALLILCRKQDIRHYRNQAYIHERTGQESVKQAPILCIRVSAPGRKSSLMCYLGASRWKSGCC